MVTAVVAAVSMAAAATASTAHVAVKDNFFTPKRETVGVGDTVHWASENNRSAHTVTHLDGLFSSGSPKLNIDFKRVFSAGTFKYKCTIHAAAGMKGIVKVPVETLAAPAGAPFTVVWATSASNVGTSYDVKFRVGSGAWKTWKKSTKAGKAVFGKGGVPVTVDPGKSYSFKVKTKKGSDSTSAFSPAATFKP